MEGESKSQEVKLSEVEKEAQIARARGVYGFFTQLENEDEVDEFLESLAEYGEKMRDKHDVKQYPLYHELIGSTLPPGTKPEGWDFPGDDSVIQFLKPWEERMAELTAGQK